MATVKKLAGAIPAPQSAGMTGSSPLINRAQNRQVFPAW